jgi:hypothetical protein
MHDLQVDYGSEEVLEANRVSKELTQQRQQPLRIVATPYAAAEVERSPCLC